MSPPTCQSSNTRARLPKVLTHRHSQGPQMGYGPPPQQAHYPQQGYPQQGYPPQSYPSQGYPPSQQQQYYGGQPQQQKAKSNNGKHQGYNVGIAAGSDVSRRLPHGLYRNALLLFRCRRDWRVRNRLLRMLLRTVLERVQSICFNFIPANVSNLLFHVCFIRLFTTLIISIRPYRCTSPIASCGDVSIIICHGNSEYSISHMSCLPIRNESAPDLERSFAHFPACIEIAK
jgi:hypothetical protein